MSLRDRLLPAALIAALCLLSACAGTPTLASAPNPVAIQFASVDANQPLPPAGPELRIHGVSYRTAAIH